MKEFFKKIKVINKLYWFTEPKFRSVLGKISPKLLHKYLYRSVYGRKLNLSNPQLFTEKLIWLMQNWKNKLLVQCTDKYEVRNYVENKIGPQILNELYQVYDSVDQIDFDALPNQFVLKCTHGCGCNIIVSDKTLLNEKEASKKLTNWMKTDYSLTMGESHYSQITPKIICEKFIGAEDHDFATDYKIWCFNGEPKFIVINTERENDLTFTFRDFDWNILDIASDRYPQEKIQKKPECFNEMISYAKKLSEGIPFVRVDFYEFNNKVVFGELTFTPAGGVPPYISFEGDKYIGELLKLDTYEMSGDKNLDKKL